MSKQVTVAKETDEGLLRGGQRREEEDAVGSCIREMIARSVHHFLENRAKRALAANSPVEKIDRSERRGDSDESVMSGFFDDRSQAIPQVTTSVPFRIMVCSFRTLSSSS